MSTLGRPVRQDGEDNKGFPEEEGVEQEKPGDLPSRAQRRAVENTEIREGCAWGGGMGAAK